MTYIEFNTSLLQAARDKVVVLTGGASGIGKAAVKQFHEIGAKVIFGDVSDGPGRTLESELNSPDAIFMHCDTSIYAEQLSLFAEAESRFGRVDIVVANAGITIAHDAFAPGEDITVEPITKELDVNLKGVLFTARIGVAYLRKAGGGDLVLVSSIAGFKESPGLTPYLASKHGVIGILRGLRISAIAEGIRVNAVCPWMTKTVMVTGIQNGWAKLRLPENEPEDVARAMLICAFANRGENHQTFKGAKLPFSGKILFVSGGKSYEIEDRMQELEPDWLGEENSKNLAIGQAYLMDPNTSWKR